MLPHQRLAGDPSRDARRSSADGSWSTGSHYAGGHGPFPKTSGARVGGGV